MEHNSYKEMKKISRLAKIIHNSRNLIRLSEELGNKEREKEIHICVCVLKG